MAALEPPKKFLDPRPETVTSTLACAETFRRISHYQVFSTSRGGSCASWKPAFKSATGTLVRISPLSAQRLEIPLRHSSVKVTVTSFQSLWSQARPGRLIQARFPQMVLQMTSLFPTRLVPTDMILSEVLSNSGVAVHETNRQVRHTSLLTVNRQNRHKHTLEVGHSGKYCRRLPQPPSLAMLDRPVPVTYISLENSDLNAPTN